MKCIVGKKIAMTQVFSKEAERIAVTKIQISPCFVVQIKTKKKDGYESIKVAYGNKKKRTNKSIAGIHAAAKTPNLQYFQEFRTSTEGRKVGDEIRADVFSEGDTVKASGTSKGKGYQGVVRRYHFAGHPATHGHKDQLRTTGAIGSGRPQRVFKGKRLPGHLGYQKTTVKNLKIIKVDSKNNIIYIQGAVPGARNAWISIQSK